MAFHRDFTLLLLLPLDGAGEGSLDDRIVAERLRAAARIVDLDLGGRVRATILAPQAGRRAIRLGTRADRARWGPFWLEAELGFPEFRLLRDLAATYEVTAVAYSEKLRMGWVATARQSELAVLDLRDEPLPPDIKALVDLLGSAAPSLEVGRDDAAPI